MAHFPRKSAGSQCEKNLGVLSSNIHKIMYGHKKKKPEKKNYTRKKKITAVHQKEWVSAEKKNYSRKKKITAVQQKEWVSGSTIFSWEKKNTRPLTP